MEPIYTCNSAKKSNHFNPPYHFILILKSKNKTYHPTRESDNIQHWVHTVYYYTSYIL